MVGLEYSFNAKFEKEEDSFVIWQLLCEFGLLMTEGICLLKGKPIQGEGFVWHNNMCQQK